MTDAVIIGGGVSGLTVAYYLARAGLASTLVEAEPRLGGLIQTEYLEGCQLEAGPDSYLAAKSDVRELASGLPELAEQIIGTNDQHRRVFVLKDGVLQPMPAGMVMMVPADMRAALRSPLFSAETRRRILCERFRKPVRRDRDISVAELVEDHFDEVILEYIAEPLLTGVYGGDAALLSARSVLPRFVEYEESYGSLIRAARQERRKAQPGGTLFQSFRDGMRVLPDVLRRACGEKLSVQTGRAVELQNLGGRWAVRTERGEVYEAKHVVLAIPAHGAAQLLRPIGEQLSHELDSIPYSSCITVVLVYRQERICRPLDGFGFLVPDREQRHIAACTWINTKFPTRIARGYVALRAFIVNRQADRLMPYSDDAICAYVEEDFQRIMSIDARPEFFTVHRLPRSMPQYIVGHGERCRRIQNYMDGIPNLFLAGNYFDGVGIPDAIRRADSVVATILSN